VEPVETVKKEGKQPPLPALDARTIKLSMVRSNTKGVPWLHLSVNDVHGRKIKLEDFDSAGKHDGYYYTGLPLEGLNEQNFSRSNLLRSIRMQLLISGNKYQILTMSRNPTQIGHDQITLLYFRDFNRIKTNEFRFICTF